MAGLGRQTRLSRPVGVTRLRAEQVIAIEPDRGTLEDDVPGGVALLLAKLVPLGVAVGVHQRRHGRTGELLAAQRVVDRRGCREPDRTADRWPVRGDVVAQMPGRQHAHREDQHLGPPRRQLGIDGVFHPPVEVVVEEAAQVGEAPRLVDDADDRRFFREGDDDMPDVERDRVVGDPDGEDVGSSRFALAADDSADGTGPLVDETRERFSGLALSAALARAESACSVPFGSRSSKIWIETVIPPPRYGHHRESSVRLPANRGYRRRVVA